MYAYAFIILLNYIMASLDSMTKQELADYALTLGITLDTSVTRAEMDIDFNAALAKLPPQEAPVAVAPPDVPATPTAEEIAAAEASVAAQIAAAEAVKAEEARIASLSEEEQIELVQWTVEEAIGILRYAISRGKNKKPYFQEDKINNLINQIEVEIQY